MELKEMLVWAVSICFIVIVFAVGYTVGGNLVDSKVKECISGGANPIACECAFNGCSDSVKVLLVK